MKILFNGQKIILKEKINNINITEKIEELLRSSQYLKHIIVNKNKIYDSLECFVEKANYEIEVVEVVAQTTAEFIEDILRTAKSYLEIVIREVPSLVDEFYNIPTSGGWHKLIELIEGINWINKVISSISKLEEQPVNFKKYVSINNEFGNHLKEMEFALSNNDNILIADIIHYELVPFCKSLQLAIKETFNKKEAVKDAN